MLGASCDGWFSDPNQDCSVVITNAQKRYPIKKFPADQTIFIGPQEVTLKWWAQYGPSQNEHYRLFIDTIDFNIFHLPPEYEYTLDSIFVTDTLKEGTYFWEIFLYTDLFDCGYCNLGIGGEWSFTILPHVPDTLNLLFPENEAMNVALDIRLEWEFISETNGSGIAYDVYLDTNDPPSLIVAPNITELYFDPSVAPHTTYYWKVIGKGPEGDIVESETRSFTTLNNAPESVVLTSPANEAVGVSIDMPLEWMAAADSDNDEVSYDVYLDTNNPPAIKVGTDNMGVSFQPTLQTNTLYYWKVVSKDGSGGLAESEIWSFSTLNTASLTVILLNPANEAIDVSENVQLTWELNSETAGYIYKYDVYLDTNNPPISMVGSQLLLPSFQTSLSSATTYYWKVISSDDHGGFAESEIWSFTTPIPTYEVKLLQPENDARDVPLNVQLKWELNSDPGGVIYEYDVYLDTNDPPTTLVITHVTEPSFWPTVLPGTTYFWKVVGKDYFSGKTVESAKWKFKTVD